MLIKGELEVHPRCAAIVAEVWKCFTNENGELRPLKDVVASASADRESIMLYMAKKLSQTGLALRPERPVKHPRISERQTDCSH